jgi:hypothetical protein
VIVYQQLCPGYVCFITYTFIIISLPVDGNRHASHQDCCQPEDKVMEAVGREAVDYPIAFADTQLA